MSTPGNEQRAVRAISLDAPPSVERDADGSVRIDADVALDALSSHHDIRERFAALALACDCSGLRAASDAATLAGDLTERSHCPYFRRNDVCHKTGGVTCPAHAGDTETLAILEGGPCWSVHPSEVAVALVALDATIEVDGPHGARSVTAANFFILPAERMDREIALGDDERIVCVRLPAAASGGLQRFTKRVHLASSVDAYVSLAMTRRTDGEVRLVLGGVSPRPYRVYGSVEEEATSGGLDEDAIAGLADRALLDAEPLSANGYKLECAGLLLRDAIREIDAG